MTNSNPSSSSSTLSRSAILLYGMLAYASFHGGFLYLILFLNGAPLPWTMTSGPAMSTGAALVINALLISLFAIQHTVMARPAFKAVWTKIIPPAMERSTFVVATVVVLAVIMTQWIPMTGGLWTIQNEWARMALYAIQGLGWATVVYSTFLMDHWELFGVRQVLANFRQAQIPRKTFRTPSLYRFVRHPMMVGMFIAFWVAPDMTTSRLVFAAGFTLYVIMGVRFEERDLVAALGDEYTRYQKQVPSLIPRLSDGTRAPETTKAAGAA